MSERLWAGWRMAYIRKAAGDERETPGGGECLFCALGAQPPAAATLVLERYRRCFVMLNAFPYTCGHLMVAPYAHHASFLGESPEERAEIQAALERARRALELEYEPQGLNAGVNLGQEAGAGVLGHIHWHLVPRWRGDTNFMPALAETRVLPEALPDTYARLLGALARTPADGVEIVERGGVS